MLKISDQLNSYTIAAGEPWIMSIQMRAMAGSAIINWSQRRLTLSFYDSDRNKVEQIEGVYTSDATGPYFAFVRDGQFSESLFGQSLQVELSERLLDGRSVIASGPLTVTATSLGLASFGSVIGRVDARFTLYFDAAGMIALIEQELLPYTGGTSPTPSPTIQTPAAINSDGTPQVGEQLTGVDPVFQYASITRRRWLRGSTVLASTSAYTPTATGSIIWSVEGIGDDGSPIKSESTIVVAAANGGGAPTAVGDLPHRFFTVGTGPQTFNIASGFSGTGLTYSVVSASPSADYTINAMTGEMVVQTTRASSGDVTVRATNGAGHVDQVFPLFVAAVAAYTVLAREDDGTVSVESIAPPHALSLSRQPDGTVTIQETA